MLELINTAAILITGIGDEVANELESGPGGALKRKLLLAPGTAEAWDECECGSLTQTLTRTYYSAVPLSGETVSSLDLCAIPYINFDVNITVLRCVPGLDAAGRPPKVDRLISQGVLDLAERFIVRTTVGCSLATRKDLNPPRIEEYALGEQVGTGPEGGCVGSTMTYSFALLNRCPCG